MEPARRRVLVVDDEEDVRRLLIAILTRRGHDVVGAADGREALEHIEAWRPDLVILDLVMPRLDGWGVLAALRERPAAPRVLVLSVLTEYGAFVRAVREGVSAFVLKPFRFGEFVTTCDRLLGHADDERGDAERRQSPRRLLVTDVRVLSATQIPVARGVLLDLSAGGAQLELGYPVPPGETLSVEIRLIGGDRALTLPGQVQWQRDGDGVYLHGVRFAPLASGLSVALGELLGSVAPPPAGTA